MTVITAARPLHPGDIHLAWFLARQTYDDLPAPTAALIEHGAITLTVDTPTAVDQWADALQTDVHVEDHGDDTATYTATGQMTVAAQLPGLDSTGETVTVSVYCPVIGHTTIGAAA